MTRHDTDSRFDCGSLFGLTGNGGSTLADAACWCMPASAPARGGLHFDDCGGCDGGVRAIQTTRGRGIDKRLGWQLAFGGLAGAPIGALIGRHLPERWLLLVFAALVLIVAIRLWFNHPTARVHPVQRVKTPAQGRINFGGWRRLGSAQACCRDCLAWAADSFSFPDWCSSVGGDSSRHRDRHVQRGARQRSSDRRSFSRGPTGVLLETTSLFTLGGMIGLWPGTLAGRPAVRPLARACSPLACCFWARSSSFTVFSKLIGRERIRPLGA